MTIRSGGFTPAAISTTAAPASWASLAGKPDTFPPSPHTHPMDDVQQLDVALDGKLDAGDPGDLTLLFDNALA